MPEEGHNIAVGGNLEFVFEHKVFSVEGCVFRKTQDGKDIALFVPMGDVVGAVPVRQLRNSFDIDPDSRDSQLLEYVAKALKFVREVHPGDSIPSEVIDGRASWMVEEKFLALAKARITMQLVCSLSGEDDTGMDPAKMLIEAESPETKKLVQKAFGEVAAKLGYGAEERQKVVDLVDKFAQEMSYIEALRDKFGKVRRMQALLKSYYRAYARENNLRESIARCNTLLTKPIQQIFGLFDSVDANTGEILNVLKNYDAQVEYVRDVRDELRQTWMRWEELADMWDGCDGAVNDQAENLVRETYRFAAQNYSQADNWTLSA